MRFAKYSIWSKRILDRIAGRGVRGQVQMGAWCGPAVRLNDRRRFGHSGAAFTWGIVKQSGISESSSEHAFTP